MRNTLENPQGCLVRGSRNIRGHPTLYLTTPNTTGHNINIENFSIVGREYQNLKKSNKRRTIYKGQ